MKQMRNVRRDILKLIQTYIQKENNYYTLREVFMNALRQLTDDYANSDPNARDPEVLVLFAVMMKHVGELMADFLPNIMQTLCQSTLGMIQYHTTTFPEFREGFFKLVMNIIKHCASGLF
jgi:exportin-1